jgi:hypothetical protein
MTERERERESERERERERKWEGTVWASFESVIRVESRGDGLVEVCDSSGNNEKKAVGCVVLESTESSW